MLDAQGIMELKDKLEQVEAILQFLSSKYKLHYNLNYTLFDDTGIRKQLNNHIADEYITNECITDYVAQLHSLYQFMNVVPDLIKTGKILVQCIDDKEWPDNIGDTPVANKVYVVDMVHRTSDPNLYCYSLSGLKPNEPYDGYNSTRFRILSHTAPQLN